MNTKKNILVRNSRFEKRNGPTIKLFNLQLILIAVFLAVTVVGNIANAQCLKGIEVTADTTVGKCFPAAQKKCTDMGCSASLGYGGMVSGQTMTCKACCRCPNQKESINMQNDSYDKNYGVQRMFPNPITDYMELEYLSTMDNLISFMIYDLSGRLVTTQLCKVTRGLNSIHLNLPKLREGLYLLYCDDNYGISNIKFAVTQ